jgi:hypothetical protein
MRWSEEWNQDQEMRDLNMLNLACSGQRGEAVALFF